MIPVLGFSALAILWTGIFLICRAIERTPTWERIDDGLSSMVAWSWTWGLKIVLWMLPGVIVGLILGMLGIPWSIARIMIGAWIILSMVCQGFRSESRTDSREG